MSSRTPSPPERQLAEYRRKRDFSRTKEPRGARAPRTARGASRFVVQKHAASHLHFDFRLELDGVMKSWAVPKGPSLDPAVKRLAVQVEDHPIEYASFEGTIPEGEYGSGTVMLWDRGTYEAHDSPGARDDQEAVRRGYERGAIDVTLHGKRLRGGWTLVRTKRGGAKPQWLLIKRRDKFAKPGSNVAESAVTSVASGLTMEELGERPGNARRRRAAGSGKREGVLAASSQQLAASPPLPAVSGTLRIARGVTLEVSSLDKVFFPDDGYTKGDLMRYYVGVAWAILPALADRPLVLKRSPDGVAGETFFQQKAPEGTPEVVRVERVEGTDGEVHARIVGGDLATLLYAVQLGCISIDPWLSRVGSIDDADYAILDLDPGPRAPFARVVQVARWVREDLDALGLRGVAKTSGARGLHIALPLPRHTSYDTALRLARLVASRVAAAHPDEATVERSLAKRPPGAVYVDFLQNARGKSVASVYCVRARAGAPVSTPLDWGELDDGLDPGAFTIATVPGRLERLGDIWGAAIRRRNTAKAVRALVTR